MLNIDLPYDPAVQILGIYWRGNVCPQKTYPWVFIVTLFLIARKGEVPTCLSLSKYVCVVYTYSGIAIERKEILIHVTVCVSLENILPSEKSHIEKNKSIISLRWGI